MKSLQEVKEIKMQDIRFSSLSHGDYQSHDQLSSILYEE